MATDSELIKRAEDLRSQCERKSAVTHSLFLTPAEQYMLKTHFRGRADARLVFSGGFPGAERAVAFFLPEWYPDSDPASECINAVKFTSRFGAPGHRDYLGAAIGVGIKREWLGDIIIKESEAYILCMQSVSDSLVLDMDHVGRFGVQREQISLDLVPSPEIKKKEITFTAASPRLDTVTGAIFGISRSAAARFIQEGLVSLNYSVCTHTDSAVRPGDVISVRGKGKAVLSEEGGLSRKGRTFYSALLYL